MPYRIVPHSTGCYRIVPFPTVFYSLSHRCPILNRTWNGYVSDMYRTTGVEIGICVFLKSLDRFLLVKLNCLSNYTHTPNLGTARCSWSRLRFLAGGKEHLAVGAVEGEGKLVAGVAQVEVALIGVGVVDFPLAAVSLQAAA